MELANMLLNQVFGSKNSNDLNKNVLPKNNNFCNYLDTAKNNIGNSDFKMKFEPKNVNYNKNFEDDKFKNLEHSKNSKNNVQKNEKVSSKNSNEKSNKVNKKYTEKSSDFEKEKGIIIFDEKVLNQISEILQIPIENIMAILSELSMSVSMLQNSENLVQFLQCAFEVEPLELLSKDGIKDIMSKITDIAKSIEYNDMPKNIEEIAEIIQNFDLQNVKLVDFNNYNTEKLLEEINQSLNELNGEITEVSKQTQNVNLDINSENKSDLENALNNIKNTNQNDTDENTFLDNTQKIDIENAQNNKTELKLNDNKNIDNIENDVINIEEVDINQKDLTENQDLEHNTEFRIEHKVNNKNFEQESNTFSQANQNNQQQFLKQESKMPKIEIINISEINNNSKVFNLSLPKTQALKNINSTEVISQIMEKMKISIKQDVTQVKLLLRPEHLGEVSLKIATQNGIITAQFTAENQRVKEIIESHFNQLKDILLEQGMNVGNLEVDISDKGQQFNQFENREQNNSTLFTNNSKEDFEIENDTTKKVEKKSIITNNKVDYSI